MKRILLLAGFLSLLGCEEPVLTNSMRVTVEVLDVTLRSKGYSLVKLKETNNSIVYDWRVLRCSRYEASHVKIGSRWKVTIDYYRRGDEYYNEIGTDGICTLSQPNSPTRH